MIYGHHGNLNKREEPMTDYKHDKDQPLIDILTPEIKLFFNKTRDKLKGSERRQYMASVVSLLGYGGQLKAERELGWDRKTIIKGTKELNTGITCIDNFSGRGRKCCEEHFPNLLDDIKRIVEPICQTDPTFRSTNLYSPITAKEVHCRLIEDMNYSPEKLPTIRTISNKLNQLGFKLKKVTKCKPKKK